MEKSSVKNKFFQLGVFLYKTGRASKKGEIGHRNPSKSRLPRQNENYRKLTKNNGQVTTHAQGVLLYNIYLLFLVLLRERVLW